MKHRIMTTKELSEGSKRRIRQLESVVCRLKKLRDVYKDDETFVNLCKKAIKRCRRLIESGKLNPIDAVVNVQPVLESLYRYGRSAGLVKFDDKTFYSEFIAPLID